MTTFAFSGARARRAPEGTTGTTAFPVAGERRNFVVAKYDGARTLDRRMVRILLLALLGLVLPSGDAGAAKAKLLKNNLLTVVTPVRGEPAIAHPFVNVIVLFGKLSDFTPAEASSFRARVGRSETTADFKPIFNDRGQQIGVRAKIPPEEVKLGRRPRNHLRLAILAKRLQGSKTARIRDTDRIRFSAIEGPNTAPTAQADADTEIIVPGIAVQFTGSKGSTDAERDDLTYFWDFGDGTTSTEPDPQHVFDVQTGDVKVTLTVSDGQASSAPSELVLQAIPELDPGKTAGVLRVESAGVLEFGAVAPSSSASRTITVKNTDETDTSQVKIELASVDPQFQLSETSLSLGPGETHDLTLTFTPSASGHQNTRISLVAAASNRNAVSFLAHGYGGSAPANGPTLAADPVFFTEIAVGLLGLGTFGYMPDGTRFFADNGVHTCVVPGNGLGTGDFCVKDQDCAAVGGSCSATSTCPSGANVGQPCAMPADCPGSFCPAYTLFDPVDLCSDGQSLYLISDEGTFTEPDPSAETERAVTVMRMDLDANGGVTHKEILDRTTTETGHIACDGFPAGQGGQLYVPEFHNVPDMGSCFRSEREALIKINKNSGNTQVVTTRIDALEGLGDCDDLDPVQQLEITPDGAKTFAAFESGGLWQIRPTSIFFSPDITDTFQIHPDGSVLFAAATDSGSTGLVNLYRITAQEVEHGALPFSALTPCASFQVPNNGGRTVVVGFASDRSAVGSQTATGLVSFVASSSGLGDVVTSSLLVRGTAAFSAPPNTTTCSVTGLVNLEALEIAF